MPLDPGSIPGSSTIEHAAQTVFSPSDSTTVSIFRAHRETRSSILSVSILSATSSRSSGNRIGTVRQGPGWRNYKRPSSRARLTAALRCSTRSLRYTALWWVFTVLSETYSRALISRRDNRVGSRRRTSSSLGVSSSPTSHSSLREVTATSALRSAEASSVDATLDTFAPLHPPQL
jgi:hypothetical protein